MTFNNHFVSYSAHSISEPLFDGTYLGWSKLPPSRTRQWVLDMASTHMRVGRRGRVASTLARRRHVPKNVDALSSSTNLTQSVKNRLRMDVRKSQAIDQSSNLRNFAPVDETLVRHVVGRFRTGRVAPRGPSLVLRPKGLHRTNIIV